MTAEAETFQKNGYHIAREVLNQDEIARLRSLLDRHFEDHGVVYRYGKVQPNAAVLVPDIDWLIYHPNVLAVYRQLLPDMDIAFTSHCDMHWNMGFGWHKDDGQGRYMFGDYFKEDRFIIKAGLYLNDTHDGSGMTVRQSSHRTNDLNAGEVVELHTTPGDLVLFDVRITHRGMEYGIPERALLKAGRIAGDTQGNAPLGFRAREAYRRTMRRHPKRAIFFTFGKNDPHTQYFAEANMKRQFQQTGVHNATPPVPLADNLRSEGVSLCSFSGL